MNDDDFTRTSLVQALQINRGISLSQQIEECTLSSHLITNDHLIVYLDISIDAVFLFNLDKLNFPIKVSYNELYVAIEGGTLEIIGVDWPPKALLPFDELEGKAKTRAEERYEIIEPLLNDLEATMMNGYGENRFQKIIEDTGRSKQYVYDCFLSFLYYGQRKAALALPIGKSIFHIPKENRQIHVKQGRPNLYSNKGKVLVEYDYECFKKAKRLYQKRNGPSLIRTYELMVAKHYYESRIKRTKIEQRKTAEMYRITLKPATEIPTFSQFYYWMGKQDGGLIAVRDKSRKNPVEYSKDLAGRKGNAFSTVIAFGQYFELDETPFDEELVSLFDPTRSTKIAKPTLYFIIDSFSKYIVGVFITTENPSFKTVRQALLLSAIDKTEFIKSFGLNPEHITWIFFGVPTNLLVDHAEFNNKLSEGAICDLQCILKFARAGRGDDKPNVEKLFNLFSEFFQGLSKAHQTKSLTDIHNQIARKHASLTTHELYVIAIVYINYHNNYRRISDFSFDREMIRDGVEPIPARIVEWSLKYRPGYTIHYSQDELYLKLLPKGEVSVNQEGINFPKAGLWYNSEWSLVSGQQDQKENSNKVKKFDCRYNENLLDIILICTDDGLKAATLDSSCEAYSGLSLNEINLQKRAEKEKNEVASHTQLEYKLGLIEFMTSVIKNAEKERKQAPIPQISTIKDNRQLEAFVNRFADVNQYLQAMNHQAMQDFHEADLSESKYEDADKTRDAFNDDDEDLLI